MAETILAFLMSHSGELLVAFLVSLVGSRLKKDSRWDKIWLLSSQCFAAVEKMRWDGFTGQSRHDAKWQQFTRLIFEAVEKEGLSEPTEPEMERLRQYAHQMSLAAK